MTQEEVKAIIYEMMAKLTIAFTATDDNLLKYAEAVAATEFEQGYTQVIAAGLDEMGQLHYDLQCDMPVGQDSGCAEFFLIERMRKARKRLTTIVAYRQGVGVVNPCPSCAARLLHFFPDVEVIVWGADLRRKVHIRGMVPFVFKKRDPSKLVNGGH